MRTSDARDGPDKTIWIVEVADSGINWMEPRDISFDQMDFHINGEPHNSISSCHGKRAIVLMADGHTRFLHSTLPPEMVRALLTIAGGEPIPVDVLK
jgi:prepilin-type processing-associated H-X9-DG protein